MNILVIDNGSKHTPELVEALSAHNVKTLRYRRHTRLDLEWADIFILTGSNIPAFLRAYYAKELVLIRTTHKPIIGICLGFELIALAYNERLIRGKQVRGIVAIQVQPELFGQEDKSIYTVYEAHRWRLQGVHTLQAAGQSDTGIEIIRHPVRKIIGLQFHPEVTSSHNEGLALLERALHYVTAD